MVKIFWGSTGKTKPSRTGPKGVFYKASATNSHAPSFASSWVSETAMSADFVNHLHPEVTPWPESLGRIQARCPALQKPRIAVHHGIWRELLAAISRNSVESHDDGKRELFFRSAVSEATHDEWTVRQILVHLGLFSGIRRLRAGVTEFHARQDIVLTFQEITSFYSRRPDGVAFDDKNKLCVFLEFTRPMDSVTSSEEGDWAERK